MSIIFRGQDANEEGMVLIPVFTLVIFYFLFCVIYLQN